MRSRRTALRAGLLALLVVLTTAAGGSAAASAAEPTLRLRADGAVVARGAGIVFDVVITCPAGTGNSIGAAVTQRQADGSLIRAVGSRQFSGCTGAEQVVRMVVTTANRKNNPGALFRPGSAFVTVITGIDCCRWVEASRTVQTPALVMDAARVTGADDLKATLPSSARLEADGAGVKIRMPYRCPAGFTGSLNAELLQRTPAGTVAISSDRAFLSCTGLERTAVLSFSAPFFAWRTGPALLRIVDGSLHEPEPDGGGIVGWLNAHRTVSLT